MARGKRGCIVKGKNAEIPDRVRDYAERKVKRIERLLDDQTDATVELWATAQSAAASTSLRSASSSMVRSRAAGRAFELPEALDDVVDKVERQAVDHKSSPACARPERRSRSSGAWPTVTAVRREVSIVKTKRFHDRADVRGGRGRRHGGARPPVLRIRECRDRARGDPASPDDGDWPDRPSIGGDYTMGRGRASRPTEAATSGRH